MFDKVFTISLRERFEEEKSWTKEIERNGNHQRKGRGNKKQKWQIGKVTFLKRVNRKEETSNDEVWEVFRQSQNRPSWRIHWDKRHFELIPNIG